ncbi:MAG: ATP-binding protein [Desulfobacterales bacterium]|nr:ATP-binding protein [Desulfobacterales bacterium]
MRPRFPRRTASSSPRNPIIRYTVIPLLIVGGGISILFLQKAVKRRTKSLNNLKDDLEAQVAQRTAELREKVEKLNNSQQAMLYMVEDLNQMTAELKEERRNLELANQELEAFAYSVSHDLRAPLRAIDGYARFLLEDYAQQLDNEGRRFIDTIRQNAVRMDKLISDLLSLSRISRAEMNFSPVDMRAIVESVYQELASESEKTAFDIHIDRLPQVACDITLIKQVWRNLIGNALKYSAKSNIKKIEIEAQQKDREVIFCITDYGAGFDERYAHKLFSVFQRLHKDDEFEGTGVGLAIVQRIIHRHGGRVWARGKIDHGAAFFFTLPRQ